MTSSFIGFEAPPDGGNGLNGPRARHTPRDLRHQRTRQRLLVAGAAVLGAPLSALVWLVNTLGHAGTAIEAGSVILPGAITAAVTAQPGDVITADFAGLGSVTARFASDNAS